MKRNFTFLMTAFALMVSMMMPLGMKGQTRETLFSETFSSCNGTGGNDGSWSGNIASSTLTADNPGWSFSEGKGASACAKFGTGKKSGSAQTPTISLTGNATLTFRAGGWGTDNTDLYLSATGCSLGTSYISLNNSAWGSYTVNITNATGSVRITIENGGNNKRFFLDDVVVSQVVTTVATPTFSPAAGTYTSAQNVTINCATSGATIYYTTDGTTPTTSSSVYSSAISVSANTTIKAFAVKSGLNNSAVATAIYNIAAAQPTFSPAAGMFTPGTAPDVTINCATSGVTIHYTTDGSTPTTSSPVYSSPIPVRQTTTIKAIAVKSGLANSAVASAEYVISNTLTATYTVRTYNSVTTSGTVPSGSSASFYQSYSTLCQMTKGDYMQLTLSGYQGKKITGLVLSMHSNSAGGRGYMYMNAGSTRLATIGTPSTPNVDQPMFKDNDWYGAWSTTYVDVTPTLSNDDYCIQQGETVVIYIHATTNSLYCQSFTLYYEDDTEPKINANDPQTLTYDATSGAFNYSISNPVQGTSLQAVSNSAWITNPQVGASQVTFTTTLNDTGMERTGTITLTYGTVTKTITITQAAITPVLHTAHTPTTPFPYYGGSGSFDFSVTNPVSGATVTATADSWINPTVEGNTVSFDVAENHGDTRSGNITLNYISNGSTLATTTVTVSQEANPYQPGTFERPYTVTEAWGIINKLSNGTPTTDTVYVAGTISSINEVEVIQYHNATYYITDGNKTVKVQYGRNLDDSDFYEEDEIQVGDRVVVYGRLMKYNANTYEIAPYNYLVSLERDVEPPLFNPTSCMMANDEAAVVYLYTNNGEEVVIYYTTNGNDPTTSSEIYSGDSGISLQGLTDEVTIKAIAYTLDGTMHSAVNSATYRMVPPYTHGLYNNPLTVQQALDSLDVSSTIEGVYVRGVVCADPEFSLSNFMNANYYIADNLGGDNQLYVFRGRYYGGEPFTSQEELMYGDIVTVFGDLAIYNGQVKEFTAKNYIVEKERPSSVFIRPSEVTTNCRGISSSLNVYYNNLNFISSRDLQFCDAQGNQVEASTYSWLTATMNTSTGNINFQIEDNDSNAPRTAYLKLVVMDYGNPTPFVSNVVPITQGICSADEFAILPFNYVGNEAVPAGITKVGLGENYGSSPCLKFDGVNDYMTLAFDEAPGELTFNIKGDQFKSSEFYLQTSTNNLDWDDLAIYTTQDMINSWAADNPKREIARVIGSSMAQSFTELNANVRYIRWIMMTHSSGSNVRLGEIHLSKPVIYYNIAVTQPTIEETQVGTITTSEMAQENETVNLSIEYNADDYYFVEWVVTDDSDSPVAVTGNHFTMPASNVNVTATLVEANQPCTYAYSVNGTIGEPNEVVVGTVIEQMPSSDNIVFNDQTFYFHGWTTDANDVTNLILANSSYTIRQDVTFHAVYYQPEVGLEAEKHFAKVTRELQDWSGDYLIVYEEGNVAFNGALETLDAASNTVEVTISNGIIIASSDEVNSAKFTIAAVEDGYSIQSASGKFIGRKDDSNELDENTEYDENYVNVISYDVEEGIDIVGLGGAHLRFNNASNQNRFRYFKSSTYTEQKPIQLYRYVVNVSSLYTRVFVDNPSGDIVIAGPSIVPNGSVLNATSITNDLGADRLVVEEGAQLVTSSNVDATIRKSINPYQGEFDNYYLIASPVDGQDPTEANMTDGAFDLYSFDQTQQGKEWQNYEANAFALQSGKGYLYANEYGGNIVMAGQMNGAANGVTISQASGKPFAGWNLIGNPYPCNVTINKPFYRLAEGGAVLATEATDNTVAIAPMEGVFVYADVTETVSFAKAPTTSTTGGRNLLSMRVSRNRSSKDDRVDTDNAIVRFGEGDMLRKLVLNPDLSQLYVEQEGTDYAIVNAEAEGEMPVSFRAATNGSYTFSVATEEVEMNYLHLIDHKTGADVDLLQTPYYTFTAQTTDYESRFRLVFATGSSTSSETGNFAYYNGSQWVVSSEADATLQVIDVMGRVLSSQSINGDAEVSIDRAAGVYLLRLINGSDVKVQKIVIH